MYIAPNSIIKILKDVPLDPTFDHTIYFETVEAQRTYFSSKAKYTLTNQMYQRLQRGYMRIEIQAENLYDCNYIMYQNTSFGTRWFYAFITKVEYINNAVAQINFMLDPMQTWFFDYQLEQCFVEREHSSTDVVGDNLLPETVPISEYMSEDLGDVVELRDVSICVATTFELGHEGGVPIFTEAGGGLYNRIYSGCDYTVFPNTIAGGQSLASFIEECSSKFKDSGIVNVFYIPTYFLGTKDSVQIKYIIKNDLVKKQSGAIDGYTPRNKKLYTYPYNFLYATTFQGEACTYPYEFFSTNYVSFVIYGDMTANPTCYLVPAFYKGVTENWDESLTLNGWVTCTYNTDVFKAWLAQTAAKAAGFLPLLFAGTPIATAMGVSGLAGTAGTALAEYGGKSVPAIRGEQGYNNPSVSYDDVSAAFARGDDVSIGLIPALAIGRALGDGISRAIMPQQNHGRQGGQGTLMVNDNLNFHFYNKHIRAENLRIIDDYFDMFGYATKRLKIPNRNVRPHWTYTKTIACVITGSLPADDAKAICSIYDRGITFWKNGNEVGNYSLDNRV